MKRTLYQLYLTALALHNFKSSDAVDMRELLWDVTPKENAAVALATTGLPFMKEAELIERVEKSMTKPGYSTIVLSVEGQWEPDTLRMQFQRFLNYVPGFDAQSIADKLNEFLSLDREGVSRLLMTRHKVAEAVADHPYVIASPEGEVGALGLINGLLPKRSDGKGALVAELETETQLVRSVRLASDDNKAAAEVSAAAPAAASEPTL